METTPPMDPKTSQPVPEIRRPVHWFLLVGVILGPPVLTWLAALAKIDPVAVAIPFLGGIAAAVVSGAAFLRHFGRTSALKVLIGLACAFVFGLVTFVLCFVGCSMGGFQF